MMTKRDVVDLSLGIYGNRARLIINGLINLVAIVSSSKALGIPTREHNERISIEGEPSEFLNFKANGEVCINMYEGQEDPAKYLYNIVNDLHMIFNTWLDSYAERNDLAVSDIKNVKLPVDVDLGVLSMPILNKNENCTIWKSYDPKEVLFIIYRLYDRVIDFANENTELSDLDKIDDIRITLKENFSDEEFTKFFKKFNRPDPIREQYLVSLIDEAQNAKSVDKVLEIGRKWMKEISK